MAITKHLFASYVQGLPLGHYNFSADDIRVGLFTGAWTPDYVNATTYTDIVDFECPSEYFSGGYNSYGLPLYNEGLTSGPAQTVMLKTSSVLWENMTATFRYVVFWETTNTYLIGALDYGADQVYQEQQFLLDLPDGTLTFSAGQ